MNQKKRPAGCLPLILNILFPVRMFRPRFHFQTTEDTLHLVYAILVMLLLVLWMVSAINFMVVLVGICALVAHHFQTKTQLVQEKKFRLVHEGVPDIPLTANLPESVLKARGFLKRMQVQDPDQWMLTLTQNEKVLMQAPMDWDDEELQKYFGGSSDR